MGIFFEGRIFFLYPYGTIFNLQLLTGHVPDNILTIKNTSRKLFRRNMTILELQSNDDRTYRTVPSIVENLNQIEEFPKDFELLFDEDSEDSFFSAEGWVKKNDNEALIFKSL